MSNFNTVKDDHLEPDQEGIPLTYKFWLQLG